MSKFNPDEDFHETEIPENEDHMIAYDPTPGSQDSEVDDDA